VKIRKTIVGFDDSNSLLAVDTIEYEGKLWLVPKWLESPTEGWRQPAHIICLTTLPHEKWGDRFLLRCPMPRAVFDGRRQQETKGEFVVVNLPDVRLPLGRRDVH